MAPPADTNEAPHMPSTGDAATTNQSEDHLHSPSDLGAEVAAIQEADHIRTVHQRIVSTIHDFCMFMSRLSIPEEDILIPPEGGWPTITKENFKEFGKSDSVIEVLRHLTYIRRHGEHPQVTPSGQLCNYTDDSPYAWLQEGDSEAVQTATEIDPLNEPTPPNVVGLLFSDRNGDKIMLNCQDGTIWDHNIDFRGTKFAARFADRSGKMGPMVEEFFEGIEAQYRAFLQLPNGEGDIISVHDGLGDDIDGEWEHLQKIYADHGWPDNFRRDECAAAVKKLKDDAMSKFL